VKITVKLFATLRENRFSIKDYDCDDEFENDGREPLRVRGVIEQLGISEKDAAIIMLNGRHVKLGQELSDGDILAIFPPIGGG
jgi:sulfur carrier protein